MGTFTVWYIMQLVYKKKTMSECSVFFFCLECCISSLQITNYSLSRHVELTSGTSVYPHIDAL